MKDFFFFFFLGGGGSEVIRPYSQSSRAHSTQFTCQAGDEDEPSADLVRISSEQQVDKEGRHVRNQCGQDAKVGSVGLGLEQLSFEGRVRVVATETRIRCPGEATETSQDKSQK